MLSPGVRFMLLATFFFALMNASVKLLPHLPATEIAFLRSVVSLVLAYGLLRINHVALPGNQIPSLLLRGLFGSGSLILYFITLQHMPLASAVTLQYLSPVFTAVLGIFVVHEKVKPVQWALFALSFAGITIVQGYDARVEWTYVLLGIGSALFAALAYNMVRQLKNAEHPLIITFYFPLVSLPITLLFGGAHWVMPHGWDWAILIFIGAAAQTAQYFMTRSYQADDLSKVVSLKYLGIVYAWAFGFFGFGETFEPMAYLGMALAVAGVALNIWVKHRDEKAVEAVAWKSGG